MAVCITCSNNYDNCFEVIVNGQSYTFDCFECAIHKLAPACTECGCKIIGHGVEAHGHYYCCANCARAVGINLLRDHI